MDENVNAVPETASEDVATPKPTFDDLLKDPEYQAEFDRKAEGMKKKWESNWQKKAEKERSEAEALAKMTEEEKHQHELQKLEAEGDFTSRLAYLEEIKTLTILELADLVKALE